MRTILILLLLLAVAPVALTQDTTECVVNPNYIEALGENTDALLRINVLLNTGGGPLNDLDTARVSYSQLISIRAYHQQQRNVLPACAQDINRAMIDAIVAAQDVFGYLFLQRLDTDNSALYENDLRNSVANLRSAFAAFNEATGQTALVPAED